MKSRGTANSALRMRIAVDRSVASQRAVRFACEFAPAGSAIRIVVLCSKSGIDREPASVLKPALTVPSV